MPSMERPGTSRKSWWPGRLKGSAACSPFSAVSASAASATVRVSGPSKRNGSVPPKALGREMEGTRPNDALKP